MLKIKDHLNDFVVQFSSVQTNFQKCVLTHNYMDYVHKNEKLLPLIQKIIDHIPTQVSLVLEREIALSEANFFDSEIDLLNNNWVHYVTLFNVFNLMKELLASTDKNRSDLENELKKAFLQPFLAEQYELSLKAFNHQLFDIIDKHDFFQNEPENVET